MKFLILLLFSGCACASMNEIEAQVFNQVNDFRSSHGLTPLESNNIIENVAQRYATQMANHSMPYGHIDFHKRVKEIESKLKHFDNNCPPSENVN